MTTDKELMQQALEALTQANQYIFTSAKLPFPPALNATSKAAEALRARLAQPESEPVAWVAYENGEKHGIDFDEDEIAELPVGTMLYPIPPNFLDPAKVARLMDEAFERGKKEIDMEQVKDIAQKLADCALLNSAPPQPKQEPVATLFGSLPVYDVPPKQEPVAWMHNFIDEVVIAHRPVDLDRHPDRWTPLYKDPTPCQTCEALRARLNGWERVNMTDHKEGDLGIGTVKWDASAPLVVHPHPAFQTTPPQQHSDEPDWSAAGFGKPPTHSEQWWRHEVSNAYAEGYEKGKVMCGCGDQIMPDDGAECGNCVTARNAVKPQPVAQVHVAEDYHPHVIWAEGINAVCFDQEYLYITPPQREWQGLTDDEVNNFAAGCHLGKSVQGAIYEAATKLKEKNT